MTRQFSASRLDVKSFAQDAASLQGEIPVPDFARIFAETQGRAADSTVVWSAEGELRNAGHVNPQVWLHLKASAELPLTCQRCMGPVNVPVDVNRSFRFVSDEETAAAQDDESEEDVLALSRTFDLVELIEDEILMDLPLAPFHVTCPESVQLSAVDEDFDGAAKGKANPFAVLQGLKSGDKRG
ncbi:MAG: YceD family protein [Pseudomonadota bacterium]